jgi:phosphatidylglycerophosphatase A
VSTTSSSGPAPPARKPRIAYFIATAGGLGYMKPGPGTWGSLAGVGISVLLSYLSSQWWHRRFYVDLPDPNFWQVVWKPGGEVYLATIFIAAIGMYTASRVARFAEKKDPQFVVIDEVSGQLIALSFPFVVLNWKSWLLGFILFRVFDIWKPFPARQAESLPGGWGIMADDWIAGIYAAIGLWIAQAAHLLN